MLKENRGYGGTEHCQGDRHWESWGRGEEEGRVVALNRIGRHGTVKTCSKNGALKPICPQDDFHRLLRGRPDVRQALLGRQVALTDGSGPGCPHGLAEHPQSGTVVSDTLTQPACLPSLLHQAQCHTPASFSHIIVVINLSPG